MKQIECHDVCYAYDGEPVLRHVDLAVAQGEAVALTGPNGAGKSTLLRLLNGLIFPERGSYFFEGWEITKKLMAEHKYSKYFHQRLGYVWQNPDVQLFCSSVAEELAFGPAQMGLSAAEIDERVQDALELFGLTRLRDRAPYTLSGGEKKKAALASILTMNPQVWTLDEPLAALDEKTQDWLVEFLQALKAAGKTLIFSTHEDRLLKQLADRQLVLNSQHEISLYGSES
ncbi:cobalt/nickel transport system ATP-binding protein [Selenomonas ruminantium]|uniref:Cobalt/nickel transport system ATP-binding protein n=1 Tax=Selenomonas ruminantium TaxID=971 RepID=A0A1M6UB83_SELRU|nr:ABC transporter ATP-binding protein [Selenomonas ruminantium]SHK66423.1 cobalt/nickel transport system ATP-binding protein [Selenomonas ruminantium]